MIITEAGDGVVADQKALVTSAAKRTLSVLTQLAASAVFKLAFVDICSIKYYNYNIQWLPPVKSREKGVLLKP